MNEGRINPPQRIRARWGRAPKMWGRKNASSSARDVPAKIAAPPYSINHHNVAMLRAEGPAGSSAERSPLHPAETLAMASADSLSETRFDEGVS